MTGTADWGGDERCTQKEGPQKARWGEVVTIAEMLNEIAITAHWPDDKGRNTGINLSQPTRLVLAPDTR